MKRSGILHAELNAAISRLGHGDLVVVADCGLPAPPGVPIVDLALVHGVPSFREVVDSLRAEVVFEDCVAASESLGTVAGGWIRERFPDHRVISHSDLKRTSGLARLFVRTGEATSYANVVLTCGVPF